jgi:dihydroorotate dehydrogenase (fumarate)
MDISTTYMGLKLKNPLIIGSSGLTGSIDNIKKISDTGAGAIVLKSIFEEQIHHESQQKIKQDDDEKLEPIKKGYDEMLDKRPYDYAEAIDYISNFAKEQTLGNYLNFISLSKKAINVPVIASINCTSPYDWHYFARRIEQAGADALELNVYVLPSDIRYDALKVERIYQEIIQSVLKEVKIPVALKIGYYFSSLANKIVELSNSGVKGLVLFNRPYSPDIDINTFEITSGNVFSSGAEYVQSLRWIGILSGRVGCDLSSATGVHNYETVVKLLLAGANSIQVTSALYKYGNGIIDDMLSGLEKWMTLHKFNSIDEFRGKMSQSKVENPANYERVQFMRLYSRIV